MRLTVLIRPKAGILDPQGEAVQRSLATLGFAGVEIDPVRNESTERGIRMISTDASAVTVLVVPTDEELEIARQTLSVARS